MPSSIYYRGQNLYDPQVVVDINNQLLSPINLGSKNLCVVGEFPWLEPRTMNVFRTDGGPSVRELYRQDDMIRLEQLWKLSIADSRQVSTSLSFVNACDPATNVRASGALFTRADDPATAGVDEEYFGASADAVSLDASIWGEAGNSYSLNIAGTYTAVNRDEVYKMTFQEPGAAAVEMTVGSGQVISFSATEEGKLELGRNTTGRQIVWTPIAGSSVTIDLDAIVTMDELKDRINLISGLTCEVLSYDYEPHQLDAFDIYFEAGPVANVRENEFKQNYVFGEDAIVCAHVQALVNMINQLASIKMTAEVLLYDANLANQTEQLAGGSNGSSPDSEDYELALAAVVDKDIQLITCLVKDDDALRRQVAKLMKAHLEAALDASRDRQAYMPCDEDITIDNAHDLYVRPYTSTHMAFVAQGFKWENRAFKRVEALGVQYMAFLMMCMQGALPYAEPITRKRPNILNTSESWDRDDRNNINKAIRKGLVIISMGRDNKLKVNRGITSWIKDNDTINAEMSARESILGCARFMRIKLDEEIGGKILASTKNSLAFIANQRLKELVEIGLIAAFDAVKVEIVDDTAEVSFDVAPVNPLNFIRVTINVRSLQELLP